MTIRRAGALTASAALFGLAGLHVAWGAGSAWPAAGRRALADAVIGATSAPGAGSSGMPGPAACFAVGGALTAAGTLVAGWPARRWPRLHRACTCGVVAVLAGRGALGLTGLTRVVSPGSGSERFLRLDRRAYSPACLTLAALSALALPRRAAAGLDRTGPQAD